MEIIRDASQGGMMPMLDNNAPPLSKIGILQFGHRRNIRYNIELAFMDPRRWNTWLKCQPACHATEYQAYN